MREDARRKGGGGLWIRHNTDGVTLVAVRAASKVVRAARCGRSVGVLEDPRPYSCLLETQRSSFSQLDSAMYLRDAQVDVTP